MNRACARCGHSAPSHAPKPTYGAVEPTSFAIPCIAYVAPLGRILRAVFRALLGGTK